MKSFCMYYKQRLSFHILLDGNAQYLTKNSLYSEILLLSYYHKEITKFKLIKYFIEATSRRIISVLKYVYYSYETLCFVARISPRHLILSTVIQNTFIASVLFHLKCENKLQKRSEKKRLL